MATLIMRSYSKQVHLRQMIKTATKANKHDVSIMERWAQTRGRTEGSGATLTFVEIQADSLGAESRFIVELGSADWVYVIGGTQCPACSDHPVLPL